MTCFKINKTTVRKWCIENGISYNRIYYWIEKGLSMEEAIEKAKQPKNNGRPSKYQYKGENIIDYCKEENISYSSVYWLIKNGVDVDTAVEKVKERKIRQEPISTKIGDMVEFWLPGKKYRYGRVVRKEKDICIIVSNMLKRNRIYRIKDENLGYFRGMNFVDELKRVKKYV